ncbi:unnamed protein product [Tilletia laevis]|uniref:Mitochondrial carrier n=2 Tax=Tilletia TaxID=13289 RepID=A0A177U0M0_9BASI|nr:hypothetical protein CF335_g8731 [Tilletia laevis]KAE8238967.1 hypothetical protein A4X03_0g8735 [Tilletia caries]KAE8192719.1 hypothetical protein CF336_g4307 [Tilletia laevis]CAD6888924.1 unnamed protein product [Tilletia caries]CAD6903797.1 unnamed protein product [Tilletia caries]
MPSIGTAAGAAATALLVLVLLAYTGLLKLMVLTILLFCSASLSVLITQPFSGALIRLRANYLPRAITLEALMEDGAERGTLPSALLSERRSAAKIGPVVSGIIAMILRTKRLEGWPGLYKGAAPTACQLVILTLFIYLFFDVRGHGATGSYKAAPAGPGQFGFFANLLYMLSATVASLPLQVITHRTVVHPRILSFRNIGSNLRELLSPTELAQPWRLYLLPGLLPAMLFHLFWIGIFTRIVRQVTVPSLGGLQSPTSAGDKDKSYHGNAPSTLEISFIGLTIYMIWNMLSVVVLAPLECAIVRLAVQRPERQQPLHLAYASRPAGTASNPASYNHQASAAAAAAEQPGRASFTIDDEEDDVADGERNDASRAQQAEDSTPSQPQADEYRPDHHILNGTEPPEPVIALRPCDEPQTEAEAMQAGAEGFGAPVVERYTGLVHCLKLMVDEEGYESLARGAWVTLIGVLGGALA